MRLRVVGGIPCRRAVLARLAEQKPQLLQSLTKRIFRRHREVSTGIVGVSIGVSASSQPALMSTFLKLAHSRLPPRSLASRANRSNAHVLPSPESLARYRERLRARHTAPSPSTSLSTPLNSILSADIEDEIQQPCRSAQGPASSAASAHSSDPHKQMAADEQPRLPVQAVSQASGTAQSVPRPCTSGMLTPQFLRAQCDKFPNSNAPAPKPPPMLTTPLGPQ